MQKKGKYTFPEIGKRHWTMTVSFDLMDLREGNLLHNCNLLYAYAYKNYIFSQFLYPSIPYCSRVTLPKAKSITCSQILSKQYDYER